MWKDRQSPLLMELLGFLGITWNDHTTKQVAVVSELQSENTWLQTPPAAWKQHTAVEVKSIATRDEGNTAEAIKKICFLFSE